MTIRNPQSTMCLHTVTRVSRQGFSIWTRREGSPCIFTSIVFRHQRRYDVRGPRGRRAFAESPAPRSQGAFCFRIPAQSFRKSPAGRSTRRKWTWSFPRSRRNAAPGRKSGGFFPRAGYHLKSKNRRFRSSNAWPRQKERCMDTIPPLFRFMKWGPSMPWSISWAGCSDVMNWG